jgi:hypothetical protein
MPKVGSTDEVTIWRQNPGTAFLPLGDEGRALLYALAKPRQNPIIVPSGSALAMVIDMGPPAGIGDTIGFTMTTAAGPGGKYFELETKALKGRMREAQIRRRDFVLMNGGLYLEARPRPGEDENQAATRSAAEVLGTIAVWRNA